MIRGMPCKHISMQAHWFLETINYSMNKLLVEAIFKSIKLFLIHTFPHFRDKIPYTIIHIILKRLWHGFNCCIGVYPLLNKAKFTVHVTIKQ